MLVSSGVFVLMFFNDSVLNVVGAFDVNVGVYSHFGVDRGVVAFGFRLDVLVDVVGGVGVVFENDVVDRGVHIDVDVDVQCVTILVLLLVFALLFVLMLVLMLMLLLMLWL